MNLPNMDEIAESPCIEICCLDDRGICVGCFLAQVEIDRWDSASNQERLEILKNVRERQSAK